MAIIGSRVLVQVPGVVVSTDQRVLVEIDRNRLKDIREESVIVSMAPDEVVVKTPALNAGQLWSIRRPDERYASLFAVVDDDTVGRVLVDVRSGYQFKPDDIPWAFAELAYPTHPQEPTTPA